MSYNVSISIIKNLLYAFVYSLNSTGPGPQPPIHKNL